MSETNNEKYMCECGSEVKNKRKNINQHIGTIRHKKYIEQGAGAGANTSPIQSECAKRMQKSREKKRNELGDEIYKKQEAAKKREQREKKNQRRARCARKQRDLLGAAKLKSQTPQESKEPIRLEIPNNRKHHFKRQWDEFRDMNKDYLYIHNIYSELRSEFPEFTDFRYQVWLKNEMPYLTNDQKYVYEGFLETKEFFDRKAAE